ncbi:hypothetical protein QJQ45_010520 [Haematococcus lacustris]|nr:hypothetical protein QJQ45_010520 [Haematococcus lacustris]
MTWVAPIHHLQSLKPIAFARGTLALGTRPARDRSLFGAQMLTASPASLKLRAHPDSASSALPHGELGAYMDAQLHVPGADSGPLAGCTVAVKDMYDIEGQRTGFGNPAWRSSHPPASATAAAVQLLLSAGASVVGRTHMDELAYSLNDRLVAVMVVVVVRAETQRGPALVLAAAGENAHYGTPRNPAAPGRIPGGSSSGSAVSSHCPLPVAQVAVAAGHTDIGLGSDTGGSVRVPASYCGVLGFRPSWGRVSLEGALPLAPSFDTVAWFTRDAAMLKAVGSVLLGTVPPQSGSTTAPSEPEVAGSTSGPVPVQVVASSNHVPGRWLAARDAFDLAQPDTSAALHARLAPFVPQLVDILGSQPQEVDLGGSCPELRAAGLAKLTSWLDVFRVCQVGGMAWEVWQAHGDWVSGHDPQFGPGIRDRFLMASKITRQEWEAACQQRQLITKAVLQVLGNDGVLMLPTAPGPAPMCNTPPHELDAWRQRMISLTCIAGLTGAPQVNLPVATVGGLPVGLSLLGPPGSDERLLELAERVFALCGAEEASGAQGCA